MASIAAMDGDSELSVLDAGSGSSSPPGDADQAAFHGVPCYSVGPRFQSSFPDTPNFQLTLTPGDHGRDVFSTLRSLRHSGDHADVTLIGVGGAFVEAHQAVLASRSHFLSRLFKSFRCCQCRGRRCGSGSPCGSLSLSLDGASRTALSALVDLAYTGATSVPLGAASCSEAMSLCRALGLNTPSAIALETQEQEQLGWARRGPDPDPHDTLQQQLQRAIQDHQDKQQQRPQLARRPRPDEETWTVDSDLDEGQRAQNEALVRKVRLSKRCHENSPNLVCSACNERFRLNVALVTHLRDVHDVPIQLEGERKGGPEQAGQQQQQEQQREHEREQPPPTGDDDASTTVTATTAAEEEDMELSKTPSPIPFDSPSFLAETEPNRKQHQEWIKQAFGSSKKREKKKAPAGKRQRPPSLSLKRAKAAPKKAKAKKEEPEGPAALFCPKCKWLARSLHGMAEHLCMKEHYRKELQALASRDEDGKPFCGMCSGSCQSVNLARHLGCTHRMVLRVATDEERLLLDGWTGWRAGDPLPALPGEGGKEPAAAKKRRACRSKKPLVRFANDGEAASLEGKRKKLEKGVLTTAEKEVAEESEGPDGGKEIGGVGNKGDAGPLGVEVKGEDAVGEGEDKTEEEPAEVVPDEVVPAGEKVEVAATGGGCEPAEDEAAWSGGNSSGGGSQSQSEEGSSQGTLDPKSSGAPPPQKELCPVCSKLYSPHTIRRHLKAHFHDNVAKDLNVNPAEDGPTQCPLCKFQMDYKSVLGHILVKHKILEDYVDKEIVDKYYGNKKK